jgi:hypothetical protein
VQEGLNGNRSEYNADNWTTIAYCIPVRWAYRQGVIHAPADSKEANRTVEHLDDAAEEGEHQ